jgi:hypothetical protein
MHDDRVSEPDVPKFTNAVLIAQRDRIVGTATS